MSDETKPKVPTNEAAPASVAATNDASAVRAAAESKEDKPVEKPKPVDLDAPAAEAPATEKPAKVEGSYHRHTTKNLLRNPNHAANQSFLQLPERNHPINKLNPPASR